MQRLKNVMYDTKPEATTVYSSCVDVLVSCKEVEVKDEMSETTSKKYQCIIDRYTTAEYIDVMQKKNDDLEQQMMQAQVGLTEVYELIAQGQ